VAGLHKLVGDLFSRGDRDGEADALAGTPGSACVATSVLMPLSV